MENYQPGVGLIIGAIIVAFYYMLAKLKKPPTISTKLPNNTYDFDVLLDVKKALKVIILYAQQSNITIENMDEIKGCIILSEVKWGGGSFYQICVLQTNNKSSIVKVGARTKMPGAMVGLDHERFVNGLKSAFFVN